ncbi:unnamed protein product, partial [Ascophyllum nodosum]
QLLPRQNEGTRHPAKKTSSSTRVEEESRPRLGKRLYLYLSFPGAMLGGFLSVCLGRSCEASFMFRLCSVFSCFPKLLIYPGETYQQAERRGSWTPIKSLMYATGGQ